MSVRFFAVLAVLAGLTLGAASSFAAGDMSSGKANGNGLNIFIYSRDVPVPLSPITLKQGIVGIGAEFSGAAGPHWAWNIGGGYGTGDAKSEVTPSGGPTDKTELSLSEWEARLGLDYWSDCCDQDWYCGPGLIYLSSKLTEKVTGAPDVEFEPMKVFGLNPRVGGAMHMGKSSIFGGMDYVIGYGSFDQTITGTEEKITGWYTSVGWRGGVRIKF
jgi:hypothetical protein